MPCHCKSLPLWTQFFFYPQIMQIIETLEINQLQIYGVQLVTNNNPSTGMIISN